MAGSIVFVFLVCCLACWRITHLLNKEDGPFSFVFSLRRRAGNGFFRKLLDCFYCVSIWTALPFGIWMGNSWIEKLLYWWAVSGAACLLEQGTTKNKDSEAVQVPDYSED